MSTSKDASSEVSNFSEIKDHSTKYILSKYEYDLYKDEDNIINKFIRIKRIELPNDGEKWKVMEDNKVLTVIEGIKLTMKERKFLRTIEGVNFLIKQFKTGVKNVKDLKNEMKNHIE